MGDCVFFFFLQSKRKLDPKKGKSQSSSEDVVWLSLSVSFAASSHLFHKCYMSCAALLLTSFLSFSLPFFFLFLIPSFFF